MGMTIRKIAELAGVAPTTVSLVLRNSKKISEETRRHVLRIIEETDYFPNQSGKLLKKGRTDAVAVLSSFFQSLFKMDILNGVEQAIFNTRYELRQYYAQPGSEVRRCKEILFGKMADAVILLNYVPDSDFLEKMRRSRHPLVLVEDVAPGFPGVCFDNQKAIEQAMGYLVNKGRRRIALAVGQTTYAGHSFVEDRLKAYLKALKDFDLAYSKIVDIPDYSLESGRLIYRLLRQKGELPDALLCASGDITAAGFLQEALNNGLRFPDDLALIGFDDSIVASTTFLGLTTIRQPVQAMGQAALGLALSLIQNNDPEAWSKLITFPPELVIRQTA